MKISQLQDVPIIENAIYGMTNISFWLLKTTTKKGSIEGESLLFLESCPWNIHFNDECVFHNAYNHESWNIELSGSQPDNNFGILNLRWKWSRWRWDFVNTPYTLKLIWLGLVQDVKSHVVFILKTVFVLVVDDFLPRLNNDLRKWKLNLFITNPIFIWICS